MMKLELRVGTVCSGSVWVEKIEKLVTDITKLLVN